jgi:autotransporter-associated beta strand protein
MRGNIYLRAVLVLAVFSAVIMPAGPAAWGAVPVPIIDAGFETQVLADGADAYSTYWPRGKYDPAAPTVWNLDKDNTVYNISSAGVWNIDPTDGYGGVAWEGNNVAYSESQYHVGWDTGGRQILVGPAAALQADAQYDLSVKVGNPFLYNGGLAPDWRIELVAGGVIVATASGPSPINDTYWTTARLSYNSGAAPAQLGQQLEIRIVGKDRYPETAVVFDSVSLLAAYAHPIAIPGGVSATSGYKAYRGGSLTLDGSGSLASDGSSISLYEWDLNNDGTYDLTGASPAAISYATLTGTYGMIGGDNTIRLRVTDAGTAEKVISSGIVTLFKDKLYWDTNGTAAGAGALLTGTWGGTLNWNTDDTGAAGGEFQTTATPTASKDDLYFGAGPAADSGNSAFTITVSGAQVARSLNFQSSGAPTVSGGTSITLGGGTAGVGGINVPQYAYGTTAQGNPTISTPIALNNSQTWTVGSGRTLTVSGAVSGSSKTLTKSGDGILVLSGTNTYSGGTVIDAGRLQFSSTGALPTSPTTGSITINSAGVLAATGAYTNAANWLASNKIATGSSGVLALTAANNAAVNFSTGGYNNLYLGATGAFSFGAYALTPGTNGYRLGGGGGTLTIDNAATALAAGKNLTVGGNVTLSIAGSSFNGAVAVNAGTLNLNAASALGNASSVTVGSGSTMTVSNAGAMGGGTAITIAGGTLALNATGTTISKPISLNGGGAITTSINANGNFITLNGITGTGDLLLQASNGGNTHPAIVLGAASTYGGNTIIRTSGNGNIAVQAASGVANALPTTTVLWMDCWYDTKYVELDLNGNSQTLAGLKCANNTFGDYYGMSLIANSSATPATLTVNNIADNVFAGRLGTSSVPVEYGGQPLYQGDNFGLTKGGSGKLTLAGINSYTGATTVNDGTLVAAWAAALPGYNVADKVTINSGGTLIVQAGGTGWTSGEIDALMTNAKKTGSGVVVVDTTNGDVNQNVGWASGSLNLTKLGDNTLTLDETNTYTGTTKIGAGALVFGKQAALNGSIDSLTPANVTVESGAVLGLGVGDALSGYFDSAAIDAVLNGSHMGSSTAATGMKIGSQIGLDTTNATGGTFTRDTAMGDLSGGNSIGLAKLGAGTLILSAANTYTGTTTIGGGTLTLSGSGTLGGGANALTMSGGSLDLGGTTNRTVGAVSITAAAGSGDTIGNGSLTGTSYAASNNAGNAIVSAILLGSAGLTKSGGGTLTLSGTNTYTGATTISDGAVSVGADGNLGNANALVFDGGTLQVTGTALTSYAAGMIGSHSVTQNSGKNIGLDIADAGNTFTVSQALTQGAGGLIKTGAGKLILSGNNTYAGGTMIRGGTLVLSGSGTLGVGGALTMGGGQLDLGGLSRTVGSVYIGAAAGSGDTIGNGSITGTSYAVSTAAGNAVVSANLLGSGGLTKSGAGTLTLSGNNTYTGTTTVGAGTLALSGAGTLGGGANALTMSGGSLDLGTLSRTVGAVSITAAAGSGDTIVNGSLTGTSYAASNGSGNAIVSAILSGSAGLTKSGNGALILSGNNTYAGGTTVSVGALNINAQGTSSGNSAIGTGTLTISAGTIDNTSGGAITLGTNNAVTIGGNFTFGGTNALNVGAGAASITGSRTITLNGNNPLTFGAVTNTQNAATTLTVTNGTGTGGSTVLNLGSYALTGGSNTAVRTTTITGTGNVTITGAVTNGQAYNNALTKSGTGTLVLAGANTYTGNTTVSAGTLMLADNASLTFIIGASGTSNKITGGGTLLLAGDFNFNLTSAGTTLGNSWTIVDVDPLGETFENAFAVTSTLGIFTPNPGGDKWTKLIPLSSNAYEFTESTGTLKVVEGLVPGDTNGDFVVDAADFITLKKNFGAGGGGGAAVGNFDKTGTVNWADLSILMNNMGTRVAAPSTTPEPATLGLLAIGALAIIRRRRA